MSSAVDLVLVLRTTSLSSSKQQIAQDARAAEADYTRLINALTAGGLRATGRRGGVQGQLLVFLSAPPHTVAQLVRKERHSDFLLGLPATTLPGRAGDYAAIPLAPADRLRLVYDYVTSLNIEGGLGITPGIGQWRRIESILTLHDHAFNEAWIREWTRRKVGINFGSSELNKFRDQFGEAVALYFAFLSSYTQALVIPSLVGVLFWAFASPYSPWYSAFISIWSIFFVEWWRVRERILAARWGTLGHYRAEKRRPEFRGIKEHPEADDDEQSFPWWQRDFRVLCSLPLILFFGGVIAVILTAIFIFEAFVSQIYRGPLQQYISLAPTIVFAALVPQVLALYHSFATKLTNWENHARRPTHDASLTIKTFALSVIVAYLGLALSSFVYVPFGPVVMNTLQNYFAQSAENASTKNFFHLNFHEAQKTINPEHRLLNQMFAYSVTNQVTNAFTEVVLPYILRGFQDLTSGKGVNGKKRVIIEDETSAQREERIFLERVLHEVSLPDYTLFGDYAEMVTQFGYVSLWSTIWPLSPLMSFINNWFEIRSDGFKIMTHVRHPLPSRVDSIGPWLDSLGYISWLSAFTNAALVYIFRMRDNNGIFAVVAEGGSPIPVATASSAWQSLVVPALLLAFSSSHCYMLVRRLVQHLMDRAIWQGSDEARALDRNQAEVKSLFLKTAERDDDADIMPEVGGGAAHDFAQGEKDFWAKDEGIEELRHAVKAA